MLWMEYRGTYLSGNKRAARSTVFLCLQWHAANTALAKRAFFTLCVRICCARALLLLHRRITHQARVARIARCWRILPHRAVRALAAHIANRSRMIIITPLSRAIVDDDDGQ